MSDDPKYRGGRPPLVHGERAIPLSASLSSVDHAAVCSLAANSGVTLSEYTRLVLKIAIRRSLILKTNP